MSNDPLGLFDDDKPNDPLGLFDEDKSSFGDKVIGAIDTGLGMVAGAPAQIAGGLSGIGSLMMGEGVDKANERMKQVQKSNFGFGEYKPFSKKGEEYSENVSSALEKPVEWAMKGGEAIAGNEGAYVAELLTRSAMELVDPVVLAGVGGKALTKRKPSINKDKAALERIEPGVNPTDADPLGLFEEKAAKAQDSAILEKLRQADREATRIEQARAKEAELLQSRQQVGEVMARLHDQQIMENLTKIDDFQSGIEDINARYANEDLATRLQEIESQRGQNPIYVDPQGQAFRGDPNETNARLALEAQTRAMEVELTHLQGKGTPEGSSLRPLTDPTRKGRPINSAGPMGRQRGAVNTSVLKDGFEQVKKLANGITLKASGLGGRFLSITAVDSSGKSVGGIDLTPEFRDRMNSHEQDLQADFVKVDKAHQGKGIAEAMYRFASELDNDVAASKTQTGQGKKMWEAFERKGLSKGRFIPKGQRGGVSLNALTLGMLPDKNPLKKMGKQKDGSYIPDDPTPEQLEVHLNAARNEQDGSSLQYMDSGAQLTAMKRGSSAIRLAGELVQNAYKRAELNIRKHVFPAEKALRALSPQQLEILGDVFKKEMFKGNRFDPKQLEVFSAEIQNAYRIMRETFDHSLEMQNAARAAKGQTLITPVEAYLSSRWQGDFRRPLFNKDGRIVWYLAADSKLDLNAQTRAVLKDHPDLTYDPKKDHTVRFWNRKTDLESAYTTMVDILGRDDPSVAVIKEYMENQTVGRGATFLNQEKHFKKKGNVRGFVGDRPELTVNDYFDRTIPFGDRVTVKNSKQNEMLKMFQQQIQYMKNGYRWSELQIAGQSIKKIINDPHLIENQPNNINYIREYFKNAIGYGESRWARITSDTLRDLGVSPAPMDRGVSAVKSYFILDKLAANAGYVLANGLQLMMTMPHMADLFSQGYRANPLRAYMAGVMGGFLMGTGHMANAMGGKMPDIKGFDFFNKAAKYAEDNGITARSIYDESPIESSFSTVGKLANAAGKTMTVPETFVRSMAFMSMAQYLKDTGKFKNEIDLFKEAERRTNTAMVDYASTERPMIFSKLGSAGNFLNTLQTFSWNYFNQFKYFWNEAAKGNMLPIAAFITMQYMAAGAMGVPGFEDTYKLWMTMKDMLPANTWKKINDNEFLSEPKLWMLKNFGQSSVYGYLSDKSGLGLTSRLAAPSGAQMLTSPAGPITDLASKGASIAELAVDPTNSTKQAQAAYNMTPMGLKGLVETSPLMEGHTFVTRDNPETGGKEKLYGRPTKMEDRSGLITRTPEEEAMRKWGFGLRMQSENVKRDVGYATKRNTDTAAKKAQSVPDAFYDALRREDKEKAAEYYKTYSYITGNKLSKQSILNQAQQEYTTDIERQKLSAKKSIQAMINVKRMEDLFDAIEKENQK